MFELDWINAGRLGTSYLTLFFPWNLCSCVPVFVSVPSCFVC
jgi:hypothetical protein